MSWTQTLFLLNKTLCTISYIIKQLEYKGGGSINQTVEPVDQIFIGKLGRTTGIFLDWF